MLNMETVGVKGLTAVARFVSRQQTDSSTERTAHARTELTANKCNIVIYLFSCSAASAS